MLSGTEVVLGPSPEGLRQASTVPVEYGFPDEACLVRLLRDDVEPLVEASRLLPLVHPHNEVAHDAVRLRLHLRNQVLLLALVLLDLDAELIYLLLVALLTRVQLVDVVNEHLLASLRHKLFPDGNSLILQLLVDRVGHSLDEALGQLSLPHVQLHALEDVVVGDLIAYLDEPLDTLQDVLLSASESHLHAVLVEVVAQASLLHDFLRQQGRVLDLDDVVRVGDPRLEASSLQESVDHVLAPCQLSLAPVGRSDGDGLLSFLLVVDSVLKVLLLILQVLSGDCKHLEVLLITLLLPSEERLGKVLSMQVDDAELDPLHSVVVVLHAAFPLLHGSVKHVLVSLEARLEQGDLVFLLGHLSQLVFLSFQFLSDRNLLFKFLSRGFKFVVHIRIANSVEHSLDEHLSASAVDLLDHECLLLEVSVLARLFAPGLPSFELVFLVFSLLLVDGQLE